MGKILRINDWINFHVVYINFYSFCSKLFIWIFSSFVHFFSWGLSSFCVPGVSLSDVSSVNVFSWPTVCHFFFLLVSFKDQYFWILMMYKILNFMNDVFRLIPKKYLAYVRTEMCFSVFTLRCVTILTLTLGDYLY